MTKKFLELRMVNGNSNEVIAAQVIRETDTCYIIRQIPLFKIYATTIKSRARNEVPFTKENSIIKGHSYEIKFEVFPKVYNVLDEVDLEVLQSECELKSKTLFIYQDE